MSGLWFVQTDQIFLPRFIYCEEAWEILGLNNGLVGWSCQNLAEGGILFQNKYSSVAA